MDFLAKIYQKVIHTHIVINGEVIMLAAFIAILVGVVFGLYPARNASKLQPVDALRAE